MICDSVVGGLGGTFVARTGTPAAIASPALLWVANQELLCNENAFAHARMEHSGSTARGCSNHDENIYAGANP